MKDYIFSLTQRKSTMLISRAKSHFKLPFCVFSKCRLGVHHSLCYLELVFIVAESKTSNNSGVECFISICSTHFKNWCLQIKDTGLESLSSDKGKSYSCYFLFGRIIYRCYSNLLPMLLKSKWGLNFMGLFGSWIN